MKTDLESKTLQLYKLKRMPNKGFGLVAARDIQPSELILAEMPLIRVQLTKDGDLMGHFDLEKQEFVSESLILALNRLSDKDLFTFFNLADSCSAKIALEHGLEHIKDDLKTNYGIIKTNSFIVDFPECEQSCLTLFPSIARINHSCQPNCNHYWSGSKFNVRAIQTILEGEEISISYMSPLQRSDFHTRDSRRQILHDEFGFDCNCKLCCLSPEELLVQNDQDRIRLLDIERQWIDLGQDPNLALNLAQSQLELGQRLQLQPGLLAYITLHCVEASALVMSLNSEDFTEADMFESGLKFVEMAKQYGNIAYGKTSEEAQVFACICSLWNSTPSKDLFVVIQDSISKLRDIV